jgi:hypothetical protein
MKSWLKLKHALHDSFALIRAIRGKSVLAGWIGFSEDDGGHGQRVGDNAFHLFALIRG